MDVRGTALRLVGICAALAITAGCVRLPDPDSYEVRTHSLLVNGNRDAVEVAYVSRGFFDETGALPLLGRVFLAQEHEQARPSIVLLSHALWKESFGSVPDLIGREIELDGNSFTIIGVMPQDFQVPSGADLLLPRVDAR